MALLEVDNLSVSYTTSSGVIRAVRDFSIELASGEALALVGETGSGKSTVAQALIGLLDANARIDRGEVRLHGDKLPSDEGPQWSKLRGQSIGMIFQDARGSLNPVMTIGAQLSEAIRAHQEIPRRELQEKMTALLEEVGMPDPPFWLCKYPMELSGGMCQIVALALAVSNRPAILIADEPTSALDAGIQAQVLDLLRRMKQRQRLALILISHDLAVVPEICDRVAIMYHGRVVECGGAEDVFRAPAHPYTDLLAKCRADLDHRWDRNPLAAITGVPPSGGQEFPGCAFAPRCPKAEAGCALSVPAPEFVADGHWAACFRMNHAAAAG